MRYLVPIDVKMHLVVSDGGWPHIRIQVSDMWNFLLDAGAAEPDHYHYRFLSKYAQTQPTKSIRYNPTTWFGKAIRRLPFSQFLVFTEAIMYYSAWTRQPYYLQRRIRPHLLQPNFHTIKHKVSLHNLLRNRLKPSTSSSITPQPTLPQTHKTSFQPISSPLTTPPPIRPPYHQLYGLTLPRRHPREGVG